MAGGAVGPGVVLDLGRLTGLSPVTSARTIAAGVGETCAAINRAVAPGGLRFPVDPSSADFCTVGGMAATNAAGARTLRFGAMRRWVAGLECVLADGSRVWIRRGAAPPSTPVLDSFASVAPQLRGGERASPSRHAGVRKDSAGYGLADWADSGELVDLLVGSEGTLAVFTGVELALDHLPGASGTILAAFGSVEAAAVAAVASAAAGVSACELLDATFLAIAREGAPLPVPAETDAVLIIEIEEDDVGAVLRVARRVMDVLRREGASQVESATDAAGIRHLWSLRHAASPILAALAREAGTISMQVIEDGAVPPARLPDYVRALRAHFVRHGFRGVLFGHAADGHVHANVLVDVAASDWQARLEALFADAVGTIVALGGTLAGEHGDGRLRAEAARALWPPATIERFETVKRAFDPDGVFNPGVKLPSGIAPPFGAELKDDPRTAGGDPVAARVLARVQRERAWDRPRLDLLAEESAR